MSNEVEVDGKVTVASKPAIRVLRKTTVGSGNVRYESAQFEIYVPAAKDQLSDQDFRMAFAQAKIVVNEMAKEFYDSFKELLQLTPANSHSLGATKPLSHPSDGGWRPWKSGKGGESKLGSEDADLTRLLVEGDHDSKKPYDMPDGYRYWVTKTSDAQCYIQRVKRK